MTVNKIPLNEAENNVIGRYHKEGKPYIFALRRNVQTTQNSRSQGEPPRREEQNQSQQTQESAQAITLQEEPIIPPDHDSTQTDRRTPTLSQQPQNITATVSKAEMQKSPPPKNTQIHNVAEQESLAKAQKDE